MFQNEVEDIWGRQTFFGLCTDLTQLFKRKHRNTIQKNYLHNLWIHYIFLMNFPLCLQVHSCSTLWPGLTRPLSPDIHFIVIFPYSSNLSSMNNGKDSPYWEGKLFYEHYEKKTSRSWGVIAMPQVCRKEKWWAVTLSLFKGLQMKFSSLFSPLFSTFKLFS